ncbi:MAG: pilus assembly protein PilM [Anaerovoracaceae bacterium]
MAGKNVFVCIEIGSVFVRMAEMRGKKKKFSVLKTAEYRLPEGLVSDGFIRNLDEMGGFLLDCLMRAGIGTKNVVFSLVSNKVVSRDVTLPLVKPAQLSELVQTQASDYFPMDISEHVLTWEIMKQDKAEKQMNLMIYAVPEELMRSAYDLAAVCGLRVQSMEFSGHASYQYMKRSKVESNSLLLQMDEVVTLASIIRDDVMVLQRKVNYGTEDLQEAAMAFGLGQDPDGAYEALCSGRNVNPFLPGNPAFLESLSEEERSYYQKTIGVGDGVSKRLTEEEAAALTEEVRVKLRNMAGDELAEARDGITESARQLIANIIRLIEYHASKDKEHPLEQIILAGRGEYVQGLAQLIQNETGLPVTLSENYQGRGLVSGTIPAEHPSCFIGVVSAALAPLGFELNAKRDSAAKMEATKRLLVLLLLVAVLCAVLAAVSVMRYTGLKADKAELEAQKAELSAIEEIYNEYQRAMNVNSEVKAIDTSTDRMNEYLTKVFAELEKKLPSSTVITSMSSTGDVLTMSMKVNSKEAAAKLLMQLKEMEYFSDVQIAGLTDSQDETTGARVVEFTITCYYNTDLGFEFNYALDSNNSAAEAGMAGGTDSGSENTENGNAQEVE